MIVAKSAFPLKEGCVRSYGCSINRFVDFLTAIFLSKNATCGTLTFEPSNKTKSGKGTFYSEDVGEMVKIKTFTEN
jgi:hypothetical protein